LTLESLQTVFKGCVDFYTQPLELRGDPERKLTLCFVAGMMRMERAADYVLRDNPDVVRVFVHAPFDYCVQVLEERYGMPERDAKRVIREIDDAILHYEFLTMMGHAIYDPAPILSSSPSFDFVMFDEIEQAFLQGFEALTAE